MKKLILGLALVASTFAINAQKFEGEVVMNYTYNELPEEMQAMEAMLPKEMNIKVKNNMSKVEIPLGMGMKMSIISNSKTKKASVFMDVMGQKIRYVKTASDKEKESLKKQNITYIKQTKVIAGYTCKKAIVKNGDNEMIVWYTEDLPGLGAGSQIKGIKGFPMEYTVNKGEMEIVVSVTKVIKKSIPDSTFVVPAGYKLKTEEEMKGMLGGFGG